VETLGKLRQHVVQATRLASSRGRERGAARPPLPRIGCAPRVPPRQRVIGCLGSRRSGVMGRSRCAPTIGCAARAPQATTTQAIPGRTLTFVVRPRSNHANEVHNGKAQKKAKRWIDHNISSRLTCKSIGRSCGGCRYGSRAGAAKSLNKLGVDAEVVGAHRASVCLDGPSGGRGQQLKEPSHGPEARTKRRQRAARSSGARERTKCKRGAAGGDTAADGRVAGAASGGANAAACNARSSDGRGASGRCARARSASSE